MTRKLMLFHRFTSRSTFGREIIKKYTFKFRPQAYKLANSFSSSYLKWHTGAEGTGVIQVI